jgi:hypothetical protein
METFPLQNLDPTVLGFEVGEDLNGGTQIEAVSVNPLVFTKPVVMASAPIHAVLTFVAGTVVFVDVASNAGSTVNLPNGGAGSTVSVMPAITKIASANPLSNAVGDPGNTLNGANSGGDTFVFSGSFGQNTINNFITKPGGNHDTLELSKAQFGDLATMIQNGNIQQVGNDTLITDPLNSADTIKLIGVSASELESHPSNFHFV